MKDKNHLVRLMVILGIGLFLTYRIYQYRYSSFMFDSMIFGGIALIGIFYWLWSANKDLKQYKSTKNWRFLIGTIFGLIFIGLILGLNWKNNSDLNKPTLVRVYYDGDYNGTSIDFKTDGTYILDNHAIGFSNLFHGKYKVDEELFTLDKKDIDNVIKTNLLEIRSKKILGTEKSKDYLVQIKQDGTQLERATEFRVVVDNRK